jgi:hypothetical protein
MCRWPEGGKTAVEHCLAIDIFAWKRGEHLRPGHQFSWSWSNGAQIRVDVASDAVTLHFRCRIGNDGPKQIEQTIPLNRTPCNFGGNRSWFECPTCHRRAGKLYIVGKPQFMCRLCNDLTHESQHEQVWNRHLRQARKIRHTLGGNVGWGSPPSRPQGMWERTYADLCLALHEAETQADLAFFSRFDGGLVPISGKTTF